MTALSRVLGIMDDLTQAMQKAPLDRRVGSMMQDPSRMLRHLDTAGDLPPQVLDDLYDDIPPEWKRPIVFRDAQFPEEDVLMGRNFSTSGKPFDFVRFRDVPMVDWDRDYVRKELKTKLVKGVTINEVLEDLARYQSQRAARGKDVRGNLYMTPGGFRFLDEGSEIDPEHFLPFYPKHADDRYAEYIRRPMKARAWTEAELEPDDLFRPMHPSGKATLDSLGELLPGYNVRLSPKREGDWIAAPIMRIGSEKPGPGTRKVRQYHDVPILEALSRMSRTEEESYRRALYEALFDMKQQAPASIDDKISRFHGESHRQLVGDLSRAMGL